MILELTVTAYSYACGGSGLTAHTERNPIPYFTAAADPRVLPAGSLVEVQGPWGGLYLVEDTGVIGQRLDLFVPDCHKAEWWGSQQRKVKVVKRIKVKRGMK